MGLEATQGIKLNHLQSAIDAIHTQIGSIDQLSRLYQTPALGFEGADFINGCLKVSTQLEASQVLDKLLAIEQHLGRTRHDDGQYHSRTIDLDLLFYDHFDFKIRAFGVATSQTSGTPFCIATAWRILPPILNTLY